MQETKINLSEYQIKKIKTAWKNKTSATIRLSYENISGTGKYKLLLTDDQNRLLDKSRKLKKGLTLELNHSQLKNNHSGGFLPILFAALGAIGALAGGSAAIANAVKTSQHQKEEEEEMKRHNKEMEKIAKGSGLKKKK
jgi:hypothetical protein